MPLKVDVDRLLKDELLYELLVRGIKEQQSTPVDQLRKVLRNAYVLQDLSGYALTPPTVGLDTEDELTICENKLVERQGYIAAECQGAPSGNQLKKIETKLAHVHQRLLRLSCADDAQATRRTKILATLGDVAATILPKKAAGTNVQNIPLDPALTGAYTSTPRATGSGRAVLSTSPPSPISAFTGKSVPVYKWNQKFSGKGGLSINAFLEQVEEMSVSRNVDKVQLFASATDLLEGDALRWYRMVRQQVDNWDEFVQMLKAEILPAHNADKLWRQILDRTQRADESIGIYVATMTTLFDRMPTLIPVDFFRANAKAVHRGSSNVSREMLALVQEIDGSYFESFTALAWKQQNQRQSVLKTAEESSSGIPPQEADLGIASIDFTASQNEKDKLYIQMLYTIANTVGAPAPGGQYAHYKEDLYLYGQRAFGMSADQHYRMLHLAGEEKPPIVVLSVIIIEAEGLEAKDANGFSDPYCMLGIKPMAASSSQSQTVTSNRSMSDVYTSSDIQGNHEKLRKHQSFKLSLKRKEGRARERDNITVALPAKFIRATTVKPHTLNPKWNEKFRFDIDDINSDSIHLDIWDHDDESSVLEAVSKLNEVRDVRGLGRFFKQVCQSARQNSEDDFLGCVTIHLQDIPSTGLDGWFKLDARSQRSTVQGRIRLKLWLTTRENRGISEEDNWTELTQHESLYETFVDYELKNWNRESWSWNGDLPGPALTILHQHGIQGDLTELQTALARFVATSRIYLKHSLNPRWMLQILTDLETAWMNFMLTREEEIWLAEKFTAMQERWLHQLRHHRQLFPALQAASLDRLEYVLRCLAYLSNMKAFWKCCPFNKEIRGEIVATLRKGTPEWFYNLKTTVMHSDEYDDCFVNFCTEVYVHFQLELTHYHPLFEGTNGIPYFSVVFKQLDKLMSDEVISFLNQNKHPDATYSRIILSVYLEVKDLATFSQNLPSGGEHKLLLVSCHEWFEPSVSCWLSVCKAKALQRVRAACELQKPCEGNKLVKHSSSAIDVVTMFCQLRDFWRLLQWPKLHSIHLLSQLLDCICSAALLYADITYQSLMKSGYFDRMGAFQISDEMCIVVNNLEYIYKFVSLLENYFDFVTLESIVSKMQSVKLTNQLNNTLNQLQLKIMDVIKRVGPQMHESLQKTMFHVAWSPDTLPTSKAVKPLFEYLQSHLHLLNLYLLPQNFQKVLYEVWEYSLNELNHQLDCSSSDEEMPPMFYERLHAALEFMFDFFYSEGNALSSESLHSPAFCAIEQRLKYHRMDTESLIEIFYNQRLQEQLNTTSSQYGSLAVRSYFNHDSLCVEILHAKDIIPLDPNGFSDPFVITELLPHRVFTHCNEQQTNVQKKTLHPIFDECFEFSVSLEQCRSHGAMVAFTVMDHDVLTANDFAGEAFLALGSIPGVSDTTGIDNFHGLKPVELTLLQQHNKNHIILQILESRCMDRVAVEFVRKQKQRFSNE